MSSPYTQLYLYIVWSTWHRVPLITEANEGYIYACIAAKCREHRCDVLAIGGMPDHVHVLVQFATAGSIGTLVKGMKGASSHLMTHRVDPEHGFKWQESYGVFSVSKSHLPRVAAYVRNQKAHHGKDTLWAEWERTDEFSDIRSPD